MANNDFDKTSTIQTLDGDTIEIPFEVSSEENTQSKPTLMREYDSYGKFENDFFSRINSNNEIAKENIKNIQEEEIKEEYKNRTWHKTNLSEIDKLARQMMERDKLLEVLNKEADYIAKEAELIKIKSDNDIELNKIVSDVKGAIDNNKLEKDFNLQTKLTLLNIYKTELENDVKGSGSVLNVLNSAENLNSHQDYYNLSNKVRESMFAHTIVVKDEKGNPKNEKISSIDSYNDNVDEIDAKVLKLADKNISFEEKDEIIKDLNNIFKEDYNRLQNKSERVNETLKNVNVELDKGNYKIGELPGLQVELYDPSGKKVSHNFFKDLDNLDEDLMKEKIKKAFKDNADFISGRELPIFKAINGIAEKESGRGHHGEMKALDYIMPWKAGMAVGEAFGNVGNMLYVLAQKGMAYKKESDILREVAKVRESLTMDNSFFAKRDELKTIDIDKSIDKLRLEYNENLKEDQKIQSNEEFIKIRKEDVKKQLNITDEQLLLIAQAPDGLKRISLITSNAEMFNKIKEQEDRVLNEINENVNEFREIFKELNLKDFDVEHPLNMDIYNLIKTSNDNDKTIDKLIELNKVDFDRLTSDLELVNYEIIKNEEKIKELSKELEKTPNNRGLEEELNLVNEELAKNKEYQKIIEEDIIKTNNNLESSIRTKDSQKNMYEDINEYLLRREQKLGIYDPTNPIQVEKDLTEKDLQRIEKLLAVDITKELNKMENDPEIQQELSAMNAKITETVNELNKYPNAFNKDVPNRYLTEKEREDYTAKAAGLTTILQNSSNALGNLNNDVNLDPNTIIMKELSKRTDGVSKLLTKTMQEGMKDGSITSKSIMDNLIMGSPVELSTVLDDLVMDYLNNKEAITSVLSNEKILDPAVIMKLPDNNQIVKDFQTSFNKVNEWLDENNLGTYRDALAGRMPEIINENMTTNDIKLDENFDKKLTKLMEETSFYKAQLDEQNGIDDITKVPSLLTLMKEMGVKDVTQGNVLEKAELKIIEMKNIQENRDRMQKEVDLKNLDKDIEKIKENERKIKLEKSLREDEERKRKEQEEREKEEQEKENNGRDM